MLDNLDKRILRHLQNEPESSVANIAEKATTTPSVVSRRLAKLQEAGYILGQELVLDWGALGFEVQVSLRITLDKTESSAFDEFLTLCSPKYQRFLKYKHFWAWLMFDYLLWLEIWRIINRYTENRF